MTVKAQVDFSHTLPLYSNAPLLHQEKLLNMEKTKKKYLSDLHFEYKLWDMETRFYEDELKLYQQWLEEVAGKNTHMDVQKEVEHFQNQFLIQRQQLSTVRHQAKAHEQWLTNYAKTHQTAIDHVHFADHATMRDHVDTYRKLYLELKNEFKRFLEEKL